MKIKSPIRFLATSSAFFAAGIAVALQPDLGGVIEPRPTAAAIAPPTPEPWDPNPCLYARDVSDCLPDVTWEICDCPEEPAQPCCRGKLVSGGKLVRRLWVWGSGRGFEQRDWEFGPRETVYRLPICPELPLDDCRLGDEESMYCGRGWAPNPDAMPCG